MQGELYSWGTTGSTSQTAMNRLDRIDPTFDPHLDPTRPPTKDIPDRGQHRMGMLLFIASLAVLFAASLVGYVVIRYTNPSGPPPGSLEIPRSLWLSTGALLLAGGSIHVCQRRARRLDFEIAERWLVITALLSLGFVLLQVPGMLRLLEGHGSAMEDDVGVYGLTFSLVVLHALHVVGGLVPLAVVVFRAVRFGINSTHVRTVRLCALYWHFLEIVWLTMFATFLIVR